jgi:hypothetical protein
MQYSAVQWRRSMAAVLVSCARVFTAPPPFCGAERAGWRSAVTAFLSAADERVCLCCAPTPTSGGAERAGWRSAIRGGRSAAAGTPRGVRARPGLLLLQQRGGGGACGTATPR